jgi:hypothetical protein
MKFNQKIRTEVKVKGWHFPGFPGLVFHSGSFWLNNDKVREVFNNGSRALLIGSTKHGLRKLRAQAQPCEITILDDMPF